MLGTEPEKVQPRFDVDRVDPSDVVGEVRHILWRQKVSHLSEPFCRFQIEDYPRRDLAAARGVCKLVRVQQFRTIFFHY